VKRRISAVLARAAVLAGAAAAVLISGAAPALADAVDDAIAKLGSDRSDHLYVASDIGDNKIDQDQVRQAVVNAEIRLAVLPPNTGDPVALARRIGESLGSGTVGVIVGHDFGAASNLLCSGSIGPIVQRVLSDNRTELKNTNNVTQLLREFAADVIKAPKRGQDCATGSGQTGFATSAPAEKKGSSAWIWVLLTIVVLGAGGLGLYLVSRRRRRLRMLEGRRAEVLSLYDRLGADVQNLDAKDDPVARQALADAAERYTATGSLLSHADTEGEYDAARRTALEGLQATRTARKALGLDLGPELPPISPPRGEQLTEQREVAVAGQSYQGYPQYTPGAPYYYAGGAGVPGGWYSFPFWETLLLGSVLTGGFGGWGGGGYDSGYDRGFEAGQDTAEDRSRDSGGGWDSGGGGGGWDSGGGGGWDSGGGGWDSGGGGGGDSGGGW
jgi:hypothetical protein